MTLNITVLLSRNATATAAPERLSEAFPSSQLDTFLLEQVDLGSVAIVQQDCCLFLFLDGSEHYRYIYKYLQISTSIYRYLLISISTIYAFAGPPTILTASSPRGRASTSCSRAESTGSLTTPGGRGHYLQLSIYIFIYSRKCRVPSRYSSSCTYIWSHNGRWVVGDGR